jgi:uncharacterized protein
MGAIGLLILLHLYIGWRIAPQLPGDAAAVVFALLLALSAALIPLAFFGRRAQGREAADRCTWAGMLALGMFSMLLVLTWGRDALLLVAAPFELPPLAEPSAIAVPLLALTATLFGLFGARRTPRVRSVEVPIDGLPAALHGFTIVQISDQHVGPTVKGRFMRAVVARVNTLAADAVAITGDLVDGRVQDLAQDVASLADLRSRHGSFFVTGNHEYYSGAAEWIALLRTLGLRVLLAHQPRSAEAAADAGFDVQLCGHTHGGQFWPWNLLVKLQQPFVAGLHRLRTLWVYTSRGTGYWGPPLRLGAPSEITRLRFVTARGLRGVGPHRPLSFPFKIERLAGQRAFTVWRRPVG